MTATTRGLLWIILATIIFTGTNTIAKKLGQDYDVIQIVWARYTFHLLFLLIMLRHHIVGVLKTNHLKLQLGRSTLLLVSSGFYFTGFTLLPLAESAAIINATPILVTILSVPLLGERVGKQRWIGVAAGFCGALIIIRPGMDSFSPAMLLPLCAALTYSLYQIATRNVSHADAPITSITYTAIVGLIIGSIIAPFFWTPPDLFGWIMMAGIGLTGGVGHYAMIRAYAIAEASVVSPFTYAVLLWMIIVGYYMFDDLPDIWTFIGASFIVGSGLYIGRRAARNKQTITE
ncbi:MAG: DMT family transporter [Rhodospirillales bacterium]|jgi:drug/metabolite transporter (DMT)-like permease|nr:DMT family transporter [Rhodospirillales bacterium]